MRPEELRYERYKEIAQDERDTIAEASYAEFHGLDDEDDWRTTA